MVSDRDSKTDKPRPFVEVIISDGRSRRFAAGTKAGFALERINNSRIQEATEGETRRFSHIESAKEGEEAVEFGPDAELVSYGEGWELRAVEEPDAPCPRPLQAGASKPDAKDELKAINRAKGKWHLPPPELPQYKCLRDGQKDVSPEGTYAPFATLHIKGNEGAALNVEKKDPAIGQKKNAENWMFNTSSKWRWPVETEDEISHKQKKERSFVMANRDKRHDMMMKIYCPSFTPVKHQVYNIDKI